MPSVQQIGDGLFGIYQGTNFADLVGYVYATSTTEWWALRTASPAYTWPGSTGNPVSMSFTEISQPNYATCTDFTDDISWDSGDYDVIDCSCSSGCQS